MPLPVPGLFTYSIPEELEEAAETGRRAIVPFGPRKFYSGIIARTHSEKPTDIEIKDISDIMDDHPVVLPLQLRFWKWIGSYYMSHPGDILKAALPSGLRIASETTIESTGKTQEEQKLNETQNKILDLLHDAGEMTLSQLSLSTGIKNLMPAVGRLIDTGAVRLKEKMRGKYRPRLETRVRFPRHLSETDIETYFKEHNRADKQKEIIGKYIELSEWDGDNNTAENVTKRDLMTLSEAPDSSYKALITSEILEEYKVEIGRLADDLPRTHEIKQLNPAQSHALEEIKSGFKEKNVCLLHGVTSSGKTEIYIHLIEETLKKGGQVLYLLPEIALTTQITERLQRVFGDKLGVYHSKYPDAERVEIWNKQISDHPYQLILGVRSSVLLPFHNLQLVIVDEEHENTYKQQDPSPRYNARNASIVLATMTKAKVLLGTATPSIESYNNATNGKYKLVELTERYKDIKLPEIKVENIQELARKKMMHGPFSPRLLEETRKALENNQQVILFQNRRGYSPVVKCNTCGWTPRCTICDVSLTHHRATARMTCHYCGTQYDIPAACPECGGTDLRSQGFGTERIENEVRRLIPGARTARMDFDTTQTRSSYEKIIENFQEGRTDILIGTQMVSKGLDFDHVSVVGILDADQMLNYPDFRSHERAYQLMAQVSGRAGRKDRRGLVILQTREPELPVISQVVNNDYRGLYSDQEAQRRLFRYPPYIRMIEICIRHKQEWAADDAARMMAQILNDNIGSGILGPVRPPVARIQNWHIRKIMLKIDPASAIDDIKTYLVQVKDYIMTDKRFRSLRVHFDVDP